MQVYLTFELWMLLPVYLAIGVVVGRIFWWVVDHDKDCECAAIMCPLIWPIIVLAAIGIFIACVFTWLVLGKNLFK